MCWNGNHDLPPSFGVDNPPASLVVSFLSLPAISINSLLSAVASYLDIPPLQSLKIASDHDFVTKKTMQLFKHLTKLEKIAIWNSYDALSEFLKALKQKEGRAPSFPALRSIDLHSIDFDENLEYYGDSSETVLSLITALKNRQLSHPSIKQITMTECINFLHHHWQLLREALPKEVEVYWDEVEHMTGLSSDSEEEEEEYDSHYY
ncbi:hypothetical protein MD484_g5944, partial [Candolleomyces efflorescens]